MNKVKKVSLFSVGLLALSLVLSPVTFGTNDAVARSLVTAEVPLDEPVGKNNSCNASCYKQADGTYQCTATICTVGKVTVCQTKNFKPNSNTELCAWVDGLNTSGAICKVTRDDRKGGDDGKGGGTVPIDCVKTKPKEEATLD
jgi:hypothetical protein